MVAPGRSRAKLPLPKKVQNCPTSKLKRGWTCCWMFVLVLTLWGSPYLLGYCKAPHYRPGKIYENAAPAALLNISVRPEDLAPERLICLASILKQRYTAPETTVGIFSSHEAALEYFPLTVEYSKNAVLWASKQHAEYYYNPGKHEEYLLLIPDGLSLGLDSPFNTPIL